jgi:ParB family chromosome partitioning protein
VEDLQPHPQNIEFFPGKPKEWYSILEDIRENGVQNPLVLANDGKTILAGHLRWEAAKEAELPEVPVQIREDLSPDSNEAVTYLIRDNVIRRQLDDMHLARMIRKLKELHGIKLGINQHCHKLGGGSDIMSNPHQKLVTESSIAESLGISQRHLNRLDNLNDLIPEIQQLVKNKKISSTAAIHLACLKKEEQIEIISSQDIEGIKVKEALKLRQEMEQLRAEKYELELRTDKLQRALDAKRKENKKGHEEAKKLAGRLQETEARLQKMEAQKKELEQKLKTIPENMSDHPQAKKLASELKTLTDKIEVVKSDHAQWQKKLANIQREVKEKEFDLKDLEFRMAEVKNKVSAQDKAIQLINAKYKILLSAKSEVEYALKDVDEDQYGNVTKILDKYIPVLNDNLMLLQNQRDRIKKSTIEKQKQRTEESLNHQDEPKVVQFGSKH